MQPHKIFLHFVSSISVNMILISFCFAQSTSSLSYQDKYLQSLEIPVGGISTGNMLMGGRGNISHIEVFNRPDRVRAPINTFFAMYTREEGETEAVSKIIEREYLPPYQGASHLRASGLPRFDEAMFTNNFPFAQWEFMDADIPLDIQLEVYNPFIPLNVDDSSFPIVSMNWTLKNTSSKPLATSLMLCIENPIQAEKISNHYYQMDTLTGLRFTSDQGAEVNYHGEFLAMAGTSNAQVQTHLYPGRWRDDMHILWDDFSRDGTITPVEETWETTYKSTSYNEISNRNGVIVVPVTLAPGEEIRIPFYLAWYFPDRIFTGAETFGLEGKDKVFSNYYKNLFTDASHALRTFFQRQGELHALTSSFSESLNSSTYSPTIIQTLSTQAASIKTNLIQMTDAGDVHGFEGVLVNGWCCPGTCTHVWNYEQTLASLFPSMERNMREIEFLYDVDEAGFQNHRSVFPLGDYRFDGAAAADGQMGSIIRVYREWKMLGDNEWLATLWPKVKLALEYAWNTHWDSDKDGILEGRQHNTYDISFFGPSSMTTSCYLGALKACAEMAEAMEEPDKALEYQGIYNKGVEKMEDILWNGEYFIQIIPENEQGDITEDFELSPPNKNGEQIPKYQYGDGCLADQLLGQYIAQNAGLGFIVDQDKTQQALRSIYQHNFIQEMGQYANVQRIYAQNDDKGVVLCSWPNDNQPVLPFVYAQEVWSGVEFAVAASLIRAGMVKEGIEIAEAVQERHDGFKRNPFMHNESGVHYARAMSSWSVLLALSGFEYDGITKTMAFDPQINQEEFRTFWSTGTAWGNFSIRDNEAKLSVLYGSLEIQSFQLGSESQIQERAGYVVDQAVEAQSDVVFDEMLRLVAGEEYVFKLK